MRDCVNGKEKYPPTYVRAIVIDNTVVYYLKQHCISNKGLARTFFFRCRLSSTYVLFIGLKTKIPVKNVKFERQKKKKKIRANYHRFHVLAHSTFHR